MLFIFSNNYSTSLINNEEKYNLISTRVIMVPRTFGNKNKNYYEYYASKSLATVEMLQYFEVTLQSLIIQQQTLPNNCWQIEKTI